jgi:hypothetical protein
LVKFEPTNDVDAALGFVIERPGLVIHVHVYVYGPAPPDAVTVAGPADKLVATPEIDTLVGDTLAVTSVTRDSDTVAVAVALWLYESVTRH